MSAPFDQGDARPRPTIVFAKPKPPSFTETCRNLAVHVAANFVVLGLIAWAVSFCWNSLIGLHELTTIDFYQAFAIIVMIRLLALTVRL